MDRLRRIGRMIKGWGETFVSSPNLLIGSGFLVAAAVLAVVMRPYLQPAPAHHTSVPSESPMNEMDRVVRPKGPPVAAPPTGEPTTPAAPASPAITTPTSGMMPLQGKEIVGYGFVFEKALDEWDFHSAWDIAGSIGEVVDAAFTGVIVSEGTDPGLGYEVVVRSGSLSATYAGLSPTNLPVGTVVKEGEAIAGIGEPGPLEATEGPHLHFAITRDGQSVDPSTLIKQ